MGSGSAETFPKFAGIRIGLIRDSDVLRASQDRTHQFQPYAAPEIRLDNKLRGDPGLKDLSMKAHPPGHHRQEAGYPSVVFFVHKGVVRLVSPGVVQENLSKIGAIRFQ